MNEKLIEIAKRSYKLEKKHASIEKASQTKMVVTFNQYSQETGEKIGSDVQNIDLPELEKTIKKLESDLKVLKALQKSIE